MRWSLSLLLFAWFVLGLSLETQASGSRAFLPGSTAASLGVSQQAHLFDDPSSANSVLLYGIVPLVGVGDVVLLSGNLYALITNRRRTTWGWAGVLMSGVSLALVPFFAAEGVGWAMVPLIPSVLLLGLSITNIVLGMLYPRTKQDLLCQGSFEEEAECCLFRHVVPAPGSCCQSQPQVAAPA